MVPGIIIEGNRRDHYSACAAIPSCCNNFSKVSGIGSMVKVTNHIRIATTRAYLFQNRIVNGDAIRLVGGRDFDMQ